MTPNLALILVLTCGHALTVPYTTTWRHVLGRQACPVCGPDYAADVLVPIVGSL